MNGREKIVTFFSKNKNKSGEWRTLRSIFITIPTWNYSVGSLFASLTKRSGLEVMTILSSLSNFALRSEIVG